MYILYKEDAIIIINGYHVEQVLIRVKFSLKSSNVGCSI